MSMQKVIFLYLSPSGEEDLNTMLHEHTALMADKDRTIVLESFKRAIHANTKGHSIRIWFRVENYDSAPEFAFLRRFLAEVSVKGIFFVRFGEYPCDVEEFGDYERFDPPTKE